MRVMVIGMGRQLRKNELAAPGSIQWLRTITASKVAPMLRDPETGEFLGLGYDSAYDQYLYMTGALEKNVESMEEHFLYGHSVERAARYWWLEKNPGWRLSPGEVAYTRDDLKYPNQATIDMRASRGSARKIIEVKAPLKNTGVEDKWLVQVAAQMMISGIHDAEIIIWPVWGMPEAYPIAYDADLAEAIIRDSEYFYHLIEAGTPPDAGDSAFYQGQQALAHPMREKTEIDIDDLADTYVDAVSDFMAAEKRLKTIDNLIVQRMGDAHKATAGGVLIATRRAGRFSQSRIPEEHKHLLKSPELQKMSFDQAKLKKNYPEIWAEALGPDTYTFERKRWGIE